LYARIAAIETMMESLIKTQGNTAIPNSAADIAPETEKEPPSDPKQRQQAPDTVYNAACKLSAAASLELMKGTLRKEVQLEMVTTMEEIRGCKKDHNSLKVEMHTCTHELSKLNEEQLSSGNLQRIELSNLDEKMSRQLDTVGRQIASRISFTDYSKSQVCYCTTVPVLAHSLMLCLVLQEYLSGCIKQNGLELETKVTDVEHRLDDKISQQLTNLFRDQQTSSQRGLERHKDLSDQVENFRDTMESFMHDMQHNSELDGELEAQSVEQRQMHVELEELSAWRAAHEEMFTSFKSKCEHQLGELQKRVDDVDQQTTTKTAELAATLEALDGKVNEMQEEASAARIQMQGGLDKQQASVTDLFSRTGSLEQLGERHNADFVEVHERLASLEQAISDGASKQLMDKLQTRVDELRTRCTGVDGSMKALAKATAEGLAATDSKLGDCKGAIATLQENFSVLDSDTNSFKIESDKSALRMKSDFTGLQRSAKNCFSFTLFVLTLLSM
jgi:chromosome segregation ATPase